MKENKKTENMKEYRKQYYEKNKEQILESMKKTVYCHLCNDHVRVSKWHRHCKSAKHIKHFNGDELKDEEEYYQVRCEKLIKAYTDNFGETAQMKEFIDFFKKHHPRTLPTKE